MLADTLLPLHRASAWAASGAWCARARCARPASASRSSPIAWRRLAGGVGDVALAYLPNADGHRPARSRCATRRPPTRMRGSTRRPRGSATCVGDAVYGEDDSRSRGGRARRCVARAALTIAVAESCTGGLLGARLTAIPGSSDVVLGGVIAYDNAVKTLAARRAAGRCSREHGAVSEPVARAMATGARARLGADVGARPSRESPARAAGRAEKPVGTVWIAIGPRRRDELARCCG